MKAQCVYIVGIMKLQRVSPFRPGFALIATISVFAFVDLGRGRISFIISTDCYERLVDDWAREKLARMLVWD